MTMMTGADAIYYALRSLNVGHVFGIISIHNIPIYDAFKRHGGIRAIDARHEQAAVHMADAYARTTGKLGVAIASTGPGAANTIPGLFEAGFASSPVLLITGQIDTLFYGKSKGFLHEADNQVTMLRSVTRRIESPRSVQNIVDSIFLAAADALQGRPQPVAVEVSIDLQFQKFDCEIPHFSLKPPIVPGDKVIQEAVSLLADSKKRVILAGGGIHSSGAHGALQNFVEMLQAPVFTTVNGRGAISENHTLSAGVMTGYPLGIGPVRKAFQQADVVLAVGTRFQGSATFNWRMDIPGKLIHMDIDPGVLGRNYQPDVTLNCDAREGLMALTKAINATRNSTRFNTKVRKARERQHKEIRLRIGPDQERILDGIWDLLPEESNIVRDTTVPAYAWGHLLPILQPYSQASATSAAIGPGLPMAIGAAFGNGKKTLLLQGDGGFMCHIGELATAAQYQLPIIICLFNDGGYGILRAVQNHRFEGRTTNVDLRTPDFVTVAKGMGVKAEKLSSSKKFKSSLARAIKEKGPVLLNIDMKEFVPIRFFD